VNPTGSGDDFSRRNTFPRISKTRPPGNAMEVCENLHARELLEFIESPTDAIPDQAGELEAPVGQINPRRTGRIKYRPFLRTRLTRRDAI
jgi:hypothetical protein